RRNGEKFPAELTVTSNTVNEQICYTAFLRDITERRNAEEQVRLAQVELERRVHIRTMELSQSNAFLQAEIRARQQAESAHERLAAIVESSSDAIVSRTIAGTITSWNTGAERLFGFTNREIIGRSVSIILPDDRIEELTQIITHVKTGEV